MRKRKAWDVYWKTALQCSHCAMVLPTGDGIQQRQMENSENLKLQHCCTLCLKNVTLSESVTHVFEDYFMLCSEQIVNN